MVYIILLPVFVTHFDFKFSAYSGINASRNKRCIDLTNSNASNGTNLWCYEENGTNAQIWYVEPA